MKKLKKIPIQKNKYYITNNNSYYINNNVSFRMKVSHYKELKLNPIDCLKNKTYINKSACLNKKNKKNEILNNNNCKYVKNNKEINNKINKDENKKKQKEKMLKKIYKSLRENEINELRNKSEMKVNSYFDNNYTNFNNFSILNRNNLKGKEQLKKYLNLNACNGKIKKAFEFLNKYAEYKNGIYINENNIKINKKDIIKVNFKKVKRKQKLKQRMIQMNKEQEITVPIFFDNVTFFAKIIK